jgi:ABC-type transport system involved in multi-copper enzyme maturation permease subunit
MITVMGITWKEILRKRVLLITLLLTLLFLLLFSYAATSAARGMEQTNLFQNYTRGILFLSAGLYFANFVVAFLIIFSAVGTLSLEIENGILLAILPRPIRRSQIFFGKWFGYTLWGMLYSTLLFLAILAIVHVILHFPLDGPSIVKALGLFELIPIVLSALSMLGSTYLPTLGNGISLALLYCLGMLGGLLEQVLSMDVHLANGMAKVGLLTSLLIPTDSLYRRMTYELIGGGDLPIGADTTRLLGPFASTVIPSNGFIVYAIGYLLILLGWGAYHFSRRDI